MVCLFADHLLEIAELSTHLKNHTFHTANLGFLVNGNK